MNYRNIYLRVIKKAKEEELNGLRKKGNGNYYERHHMLPKSLFPLWSKRKSNIVLLTAREHFFCHQLLIKIYPCYQMYCALTIFETIDGKKLNLTSRQYAQIREARKLAGSILGKKYNISKDELSKIRSAAAKKYWESLSDEEREKKLWPIHHSFYSAERRKASSLRMSELNKNYSFEKRSSASKKAWQNMPSEKKEELKRKRSELAKKFMSTVGEDFKEKHREACKKSLGKKIKCVNDGLEFMCINDAAAYYNINRVTIRHSLDGSVNGKLKFIRID